MKKPQAPQTNQKTKSPAAPGATQKPMAKKPEVKIVPTKPANKTTVK